MLESGLEIKVKIYAEGKGCFFYKFVSPGRRGVPDRMIITPYGVVGFIELKAKGEKPNPLQRLEIKRMEGMDINVMWTDSYEKATKFIDKLLTINGLNYGG